MDRSPFFRSEASQHVSAWGWEQLAPGPHLAWPPHGGRLSSSCLGTRSRVSARPGDGRHPAPSDNRRKAGCGPGQDGRQSPVLLSPAFLHQTPQRLLEAGDTRQGTPQMRHLWGFVSPASPGTSPSCPALGQHRGHTGDEATSPQLGAHAGGWGSKGTRMWGSWLPSAWDTFVVSPSSPLEAGRVCIRPPPQTLPRPRADEEASASGRAAGAQSPPYRLGQIPLRGTSTAAIKASGARV